MAHDPDPHPKATIVFDALCGWSYAAWPVLEKLWLRYRDQLEVEVVSGGLFVGDRIQPIGSIAFIPEANGRISELSGAVFGEGYETLRLEGSYLLDSTEPAWRFAVLRSLAPASAVPMAHDLQVRHYFYGADLNHPAVYRAVGKAVGIGAEVLDAAFAAANPSELATGEFGRSHDLGVHAFPTVILSVNGTTAQVGEGLPDKARLFKIVDAALLEGSR